MTLSRRQMVCGIGGVIVTDLVRPSRLHADVQVDIAMRGGRDGADAWFEPIGLLVNVGSAVRWTNRDAGNVHTSTAYHPKMFDRPRRIPAGAEPWNSDYLMPDESFSIIFSVPGVYDFYCIPHEHSGMVGRIVVVREGGSDVPAAPERETTDLPDIALRAFPTVEEIHQKRVIVRRP